MIMDISTITDLVKNVVDPLAPALPYLLKMGGKTLEALSEKIGSKAANYVTLLWDKLRPKAEASPDLQKAVKDVAATPEDADLQAVLRVQLRTLLARDTELARELSGILQDAKNAGVTVIAIGNRNVATGGDVIGSTIITGDNNK
jgi:hypothetical protein